MTPAAGGTVNVSDVMSTDPMTVTPETSLKDAARVMVNGGVSGLPVLDHDGTLVGIITEADFVERTAGAHARRRRLFDHIFGPGDTGLAGAEVVADAMTADVVTVEAEDSVTTAARKMVTFDVKRLPVIDQDGRLSGVVSRADVMRAFARSDAEIAVDVHAMLRRLPIDPEAVQVSVEDGVVSLRGEVDGRPDRLVVDELVAHIDGVVRVDDQLTWNVDDRVPEQRWPGFAQEGAGR
jgi:CBS-domain-containing membrane protein